MKIHHVFSVPFTPCALRGLVTPWASDPCFRLKAGGRSANLKVRRTSPQAVAVAVRPDPLRLAGFLGDSVRYAPCLPAGALAQESLPAEALQRVDTDTLS